MALPPCESTTFTRNSGPASEVTSGLGRPFTPNCDPTSINSSKLSEFPVYMKWTMFLRSVNLRLKKTISLTSHFEQEKRSSKNVDEPVQGDNKTGFNVWPMCHTQERNDTEKVEILQMRPNITEINKIRNVQSKQRWYQSRQPLILTIFLKVFPIKMSFKNFFINSWISGK